MPRGAVHASHLVIVEIALVDLAVGCGDLSKERQARSENCRALELITDIVRCNDGPGIHRRPDVRNVDLAFTVDFDFHHRSDVGQEAAMGSDAEPVSFTRIFLSPARSLRCDLDYTPQASGVQWVRFCFFRLVTLVLKVDSARRANQPQQIVN